MHRHGIVSSAAGAAFFALALFATPAIGHHSSRGIYDGQGITEVRGIVQEVSWRNPHVRFKIRGRSDAGRDALWEVESASVAMLGRRGISRDALNVGDRIRVAGNPAISGAPEMYVTNILLPDGREILTLPRAEARWADEPIELRNWTFSEAEIAEARRKADGIFRVWSMPGDGLWNDSYPLTAAAMAARQQWDPVNSPYVSCVKGMPSIMEQPYPMEFVRRGENVELHIEEYDVVRTIEMDPRTSVEGREPATWGHSTGRWEEDTLVVTTTGISWPYFDQTGIPLNETSVLVERFTPSPDGSRLDYQLTVTDPEIFAESVVLDRYWVWNPGEQVRPFNCEPPTTSE